MKKKRIVYVQVSMELQNDIALRREALHLIFWDLFFFSFQYFFPAVFWFGPNLPENDELYSSWGQKNWRNGKIRNCLNERGRMLTGRHHNGMGKKYTVYQKGTGVRGRAGGTDQSQAGTAHRFPLQFFFYSPTSSRRVSFINAELDQRSSHCLSRDEQTLPVRAEESSLFLQVVLTNQQEEKANLPSSSKQGGKG